jgi:hypothetical protein
MCDLTNPTVEHAGRISDMVKCEGLLIESAAGVGECDRGEECAATEVRAEYDKYRQAHSRITAEWVVSGDD